MMYCHILSDGSLSDPFDINSQYVRDVTRCGNPDRLDDLSPFGLIPLVSDTDDAPLGYSAPTIRVDADGKQYAYRLAIGTVEERSAESLRKWRAGMVLESWRGIGYLMDQPAKTEGPLAVYPGPKLYDQVEAMLHTLFSSGLISGMVYSRWKNVNTWHRIDPQLVEIGAIANLTDTDIDDWFRSASEWRRD